MAIKETIPFDYNEVYNYVKNKFEENGYDAQEGSNTMQLVSAMSYLVSMLNTNTAVNINETLLTLVRKRTMALVDARVLGYEVQHRTSYKYNLTLEFDVPGTYIINKYSSFTSGDKTYYFMGGTDVVEPTVTVVDDPVSITIEVKEGELIKYDEEESLTKQIENVYNADRDITEAQHYVDIAYTNVEDDGVEVFLTYYDDSGVLHSQEPWTKSSTFLIDSDTVLNRQFVRLDNIEYGTPRIYFKIGDVGKDLRVGTIVQTSILRSTGSEGAITDEPTPVDLNCTVTDYSLIIQGAEEESISSIKTNAPLFHNSANRVVTKPDYIAFANRQSSVRITDVWDGHDEYPNKSGEIWFSFIPSNTVRSFTKNSTGTNWSLDSVSDNSNWYIGDYQTVFNYMNDYKIPTLKYNHRNPIYFDFDYEINIVRYTSALSISDRNQLVFDVINNYFIGLDTDDGDEAESFGFEYFESNLNKRIDEELTDLMGFNNVSKYSISLNNNNIIEENLIDSYDDEYYKEIRFHLGVPYETFIDESLSIITDKLPRIDTDNIIGTDKLYVDYTSQTTEKSGEIVVYNIKFGNDIDGYENIGLYKVYTGVIQTIEIVLYVISDNGHSVGLSTSDVTSGITLDVVYPSPNIRFSRNTIPRLKNVDFV